MARFLLVPGSCHGIWCWDLLRAELARLGHHAQGIELPGHGADPTPRAGITLDDYARAIRLAVDQGGPAILLGHSMAGYPITAAAERDPGKLRALVYLCAYRPRHGRSVADLRRAADRQPLRGTFRLAAGCFTFDPAVVVDRFYHDCPADLAADAAARLTPEPIAPQETPLDLTAASGDLLQFYIRCTADRAIPPEHQAMMAADLPAEHVMELPSSHSPFLAMPARLAVLLDGIAGRLP